MRAFGLIFCKYVPAFIDDKERFLTHLVSLLSDGGTCVMISPDREVLPAAKQQIAVGHDDVIVLLKRHFSDIRCEKIAHDYYFYATK